MVIVRWGWTFITHGRSTRLITGLPLLPPIEDPEPPALAPLETDGDAPRDDAAAHDSGSG